MVDYILGNMDDREKSLFENHLKTCQHCEQQYYQWAELLGTKEENEENEVEGAPPALIKRRVLVSIIKDKWLRPIFSKNIFGVAAVCGMLIFAFMLGRISIGGTVQPRPFQINPTQSFSQVSYAPTTYQVVPVNHQNLKGYMWVNKSTNELYLFVDGLEHKTGTDYQAWLVTANQQENGGLLKWNQHFAHMYIHNANLPNINKVIVSLEPKGGSKKLTGPQALYVNINNNN